MSRERAQRRVGLRGGQVRQTTAQTYDTRVTRSKQARHRWPRQLIVGRALHLPPKRTHAVAAPEPPERRSSAPNMANHTSEEHCPLSRCVTEPGYCNSEIEDDQFRALVLCVCVPLLLAFLSPIVASLFSLHFRSGSCCHGDDDRPARAPLHRSAIDPPMFLGGVGLLPLECGFSGLLTIIWVMSATFVGTFFYLLNQSHPCSTALGECRTISCICGNAIPEGYVFMFSCLCAAEASNPRLAGRGARPACGSPACASPCAAC